MMYAILGATGRVGGATARAVLARGANVRVVARNPERGESWRARGAEVAIADITDGDALARAFDGVAAAFVATPPQLELDDPFVANEATLAALSHAIVAARVPYVVYLSSIGAQHASGTGAIRKLYEVERAFASLPVASVALRAGWFMENDEGQIGAALADGTLPSMLAPLDLAVPIVTTADIGRVAAELLLAPRSGRSVVEHAHARAYSSADVAATLGAALGRPVTATAIAPSARVATYRAWGLSDGGARAMSEMIDGFNSRRIVFEGGSAERRDAPTPLEAVLRELVPVA